jgi:hypothetical protein
MGIGLVFWILMLIWLAFTLWWNWPVTSGAPIAGNLFIFILFLLLGWAVFGPPIHG